MVICLLGGETLKYDSVTIHGMNYVCHSGGCPGADMMWETEGEKYGVKTIAYSFSGHVQEGKHPYILSGKELDEGWEHVLIADNTLKKDVKNVPLTYVRSLLARNWFQVKNADGIFAIGMLEHASKVKGGTGMAVQMAIDNHKSVWVNDQIKEDWLYFDYGYKMFLPMGGIIPKLTENFAGIGTRDLNDNGREAIRRVYQTSFLKKID